MYTEYSGFIVKKETLDDLPRKNFIWKTSKIAQ